MTKRVSMNNARKVCETVRSFPWDWLSEFLVDRLQRRRKSNSHLRKTTVTTTPIATPIIIPMRAPDRPDLAPGECAPLVGGEVGRPLAVDPGGNKDAAKSDIVDVAVLMTLAHVLPFEI